MNWTLNWLVFGAAAFLLALLCLGRAIAGKERGWTLLLYGSLACGVLSLLEEYRAAVDWVRWEDWSALMDVLPNVEPILTAAVLTGLGLDLAAVLIYERRKNQLTMP